MKFLSVVSLLFVPLVLSQDVVQFGGSEESQAKLEEGVTKFEEGENVDTKNGEVSEEDVNTRFFNVDLGEFGNNVAASALGSVIGNVGTNLAGNFLNGCSNRGRRSVLMHKIEKRQAVEANEKSGNPEADPEVAERFLPCPQNFLSPGNNKPNNYCDRCYCSDWDCRRDCRKCSYYNNSPNNWSSGSGGSSGNNNWSSGSTSSSLNCRTCACSNYSCRNGCSKCYSSNSNTNYYPSNSNQNSYPSNNNHNSYPSNNNYGVNCDTCNCSNRSCRNDCARCHLNTNSNNYGWSSSSSSGGNYNNGWRNGVNGRTGEDSEASEVVVQQSSSDQKDSNDGEVVFA